MKKRAYIHSANTYIEKMDKEMRKRFNVGTGRKDRKKAMMKIREIEARTI